MTVLMGFDVDTTRPIILCTSSTTLCFKKWHGFILTITKSNVDRF